jgi:hypothetical protein
MKKELSPELLTDLAKLFEKHRDEVVQVMKMSRAEQAVLLFNTFRRLKSPAEVAVFDVLTGIADQQQPKL